MAEVIDRRQVRGAEGPSSDPLITRAQVGQDIEICGSSEGGSAPPSDGDGTRPGDRQGRPAAEVQRTGHLNGRPVSFHNVASLPGASLLGSGRNYGSDEVENVNSGAGDLSREFWCRNKDGDRAAMTAPSSRLKSVVVPAAQRDRPTSHMTYMIDRRGQRNSYGDPADPRSRHRNTEHQAAQST